MYSGWATALTCVYSTTGDPVGRFRTPVGVIATSNPVGVIASSSRIPVSGAIIANSSSAPPTAPSSATERLHNPSLITLNGVPVPPPSDPPSSGSASSSSSSAYPPTAHPPWKGPSAVAAAQPLHSNAPFDDFSDKDVRDQALEAILALVSCSAALALRVLSVPRLMDILLRVIMVSSISSYGGAVVAPNSSTAYSQSDTISAASRVLQVWTRYHLVFNYHLIG